MVYNIRLVCDTCGRQSDESGMVLGALREAARLTSGWRYVRKTTGGYLDLCRGCAGAHATTRKSERDVPVGDAPSPVGTATVAIREEDLVPEYKAPRAEH
jgi:hypothetical protein